MRSTLPMVDMRLSYQSSRPNQQCLGGSADCRLEFDNVSVIALIESGYKIAVR